MARATTRTHLSLDTYARIMGINPVHFNGASAGEFFPCNCSDAWRQHSWQWADVVGREDLALTIASAEDDLEKEIGFPLAPTWREDIVRYPAHYRRGALLSVANAPVTTLRGRVTNPGRRAVAAVKLAAAVVYSDEDGDGFYETATVTAATTLTDALQICAFTAGTAGDETWEIRPPRTRTISGGNVVLTFWSWQMIRPELWEEFPTSNDDLRAIDLAGLAATPPVTTNVVTTVDVYRVYTDASQVASRFLWGPRVSPNVLLQHDVVDVCAVVNCESCELTQQDGCLTIRDSRRGVVVPSPGEWSDANATWTCASFALPRPPDQVILWYACGEYSNDYLLGRSGDPLPRDWALAVAQLATARLERPLCQCGNTSALAVKLQADLAVASEVERFNISDNDMGNPLGTRYGEILAWRQVRRAKRSGDTLPRATVV